MTIREHLLIVWEKTGQRPVELKEAELPEMMAHVWAWFCSLRGRVAPGFAGTSPITWPDMQAWAAITGNHPTPFEIECLVALDDILLNQPR